MGILQNASDAAVGLSLGKLYRQSDSIPVLQNETPKQR